VIPLLDKQLVFVTGKGGVGKTVTAAALARLSARRGRRTLLCELDTDPTMGRIFGKGRIGFAPDEVAPNLYACCLDGASCMNAFVHRFVPSRKIADMILGNKVANTFFEAAPSVMEAVILDQLATLVTESSPRFDLVVVDMPASGHAVTLLKVPRSMARMVAVGELADHLRRIAALISDPRRTEVVIVTLPDEMAVNESIELWRKLRDAIDTPSETILVNGTRGVALKLEDAAIAAAHVASDARVLEAVRLGLYWQREDAANVERLSNAVVARVFTNAFVFDKVDDSDLVDRCADALQPRLGIVR